MKTSVYTLLIFLLFQLNSQAQVFTRVEGRTFSAEGTVAFAEIKLTSADGKGGESIRALSDSLGVFRLENVLPGRYTLTIIAAGFVEWTTECLATSGKAVYFEVELEKSSVLLEAVEVRAGTAQAEVGAYGIPIEKTLRMPANFFDPVRLAAVLPGVAVANDQGNAIAIRGYSPNAMSWRLEGLDIVNPNHLANAGTLSDRPIATGGGVSILSSQVLDNSTFRRDALPASVGNALSGVMDLNLRKGNHQKPEYTVQAGLIGMDVAGESPVGKSGRGSILADLRYSTVGLLGAMGVDFGGEQINFYDGTVHMNVNHRKGGDLSMFGFFGRSVNQFNNKEQQLWETEKDRYDIRFQSRTYGIGLRDTRILSSKVGLRYGAAWSSQYQTRTASTPYVIPLAHVISEDFGSDRSILSAYAIMTVRYHPSFSAEYGAYLTHSLHSLDMEFESSVGPASGLPTVNGRVEGSLLQPFAGWNFRKGRMEINAAVRYVHFTWNKTGEWEPRAHATMASGMGSWSVGYGVTSQQQQTSTLLFAGNSTLPLMRSGQWYVAHQVKLGKSVSWQTTLFQHRLTNVPAYSASGVQWSALNQFDDVLLVTLSKDGTGFNRGVESMVEKKFDAGYYLLASGSIYSARYGFKGDSKTYSARFSGGYTSVLAAGREWQRKRNVLGIHTRFTALGGQRTTPVDVVASATAGTTVMDFGAGYSQQLPDYLRLDARFSWRKNKPGRTRTLSLDIQNLTSRENLAGYYFDTFLQQVQPRKQLGIIPVLTWRVDF